MNGRPMAASLLAAPELKGIRCGERDVVSPSTHRYRSAGDGLSPPALELVSDPLGNRVGQLVNELA